MSQESAILEWERLFNSKQTRLKYRNALAGDGGGTVDVVGEPGFIWCRYSADQSKVSKVFNMIAPGVPENFPIKVGRLFPDDEFEQVLVIDWTLYQDIVTQDAVDNFTTGNHGESHNAADGADPAPIDLRNIIEMRGRAQATADLTIHIEQTQYIFGFENVNRYPGEDIDLTASVPAGAGHRYVLVYVDGTTNAASFENSIVVPIAATPIIPDPTVNTIPVCVVELANGQTTITEDDIFDWRFLWNIVHSRSIILSGTNADRLALIVGNLTDYTLFYTTDTDKVWEIWEAAWRLVHEPSGLSTSDGDAGTPWSTDGTGILTGSQNLVLDDGSDDSPKLIFRGGSNDDEIELFLEDHGTAGRSDLNLHLVDNVGNSEFWVTDLAGTIVFRLSSDGRLVVNEDGRAAADFRVEGDTDTRLLFTDAANDRVGIGGTPTAKLEIFLGNDNMRMFGAFPGFWLQESGVGEKGALFVLDGELFQIQQRATNYGAFISTPFSMNMAGPTNAFAIQATEMVVNEAGLAACDFRVEGDTNTHLIFADAGTIRVGIGTANPGQIFDVNQGSGNMIADGYDNHSLSQWKEELGDIDTATMLESVLAIMPKQWKRTPFVSTGELVNAAWDHFDIPENEQGDPRKYLEELKNPQILAWIDTKRESLRVERKEWPIYQRLHYGLVADNEATIQKLPDVVSRSPDTDEPCGISLSNYVGALHAAIIALEKRII